MAANTINIKSLVPKFVKEAGHETVQWGLTIKVLKRIFTAFPFWDEEDALRVARMARIEAKGPIALHHLSPANVRRLHELADKTHDGRYYDPNESPETVRLYRLLKRKAEEARRGKVR
jgi:hypothetical protein